MHVHERSYSIHAESLSSTPNSSKRKKYSVGRQSGVLLFSCSGKLKQTLSYPLVLRELLPPQKKKTKKKTTTTTTKKQIILYHKSFIDQACAVKFMAAFSFRSRPVQTQRKTWQVCIYLDLTIGLEQTIKTCYASNTMNNLT